MPRYAAFLRAINVGKRRVAMADLRRHLESLGFDEPRTLLASGNAAFHAPSRSAAAVERTLETGLAERLGFHSDAFVRNTAELDAILAHAPFGAIPAGVTVHIALLKTAPKGLAAALRPFETADDAFDVAGREVYWRRVGRMSDGEFSGAALERLLDAPATFRKRDTIEKMRGLVD
jgi:uncharacterized protein (DUF1697 family)